MLSNINYSSSEIEELEEKIAEINQNAVDKSANLTHLKTHLDKLSETTLGRGKTEIMPFPKKIRDLSKNFSLHFGDNANSSFSMEYHGMGTRSWASMLTVKAFTEMLRDSFEKESKPFFSLIAAEEPEAHLHPNAQRTLYNQLASMENQVIVSEDLNVKGMLKNHKLAKSIQDASFSSFCGMIGYKAKEQNRTYIKIGTFYPSSKLCHHCGYKNKELKLSDRFWICPECGSYLDRDENAAINILNEGLKILSRNTDGRSGRDESLKPVDTVNDSSLEQEPAIASGSTTCHAGRSSALAE